MTDGPPRCECNPGWKGKDCRENLCGGDCGGEDQGECGQLDSGVLGCKCHAPWTGTNCTSIQCSSDCSGHGACVDFECRCDAGWTGPYCEEHLCEPHCQFGDCHNGVCVCDAMHTGPTCGLLNCPHNCNGHGSCDYMAGVCHCEDGWMGRACETFSEALCLATCESKCDTYQHKGEVPILHDETGTKTFLNKRDCVKLCSSSKCRVTFQLGPLPSDEVNQAKIEAGHEHGEEIPLAPPRPPDHPEY